MARSSMESRGPDRAAAFLKSLVRNIDAIFCDTIVRDYVRAQLLGDHYAEGAEGITASTCVSVLASSEKAFGELRALAQRSELQRAAYEWKRANAAAAAEVDLIHKIEDAGVLAKDFLSSVESYMFSGKKLTLAIGRDLNNFEREKFFAALARWKEEMRRRNPEVMGRLLENVVAVSFESKEDLSTKLNELGIDPSDTRNNFIFTFSHREKGANPMMIGQAVHPVYIDDSKMTAGCYYPMIEIMTISMARELMCYSKSKIKEVLESLGIDLAMLAITNFALVDDPDTGRYMVFKLLPPADKHNASEHVDRYKQLLKFIESA